MNNEEEILHETNKFIILALFNSLCNTKYDDILKIETNDVNYIFHVHDPNPPQGFPEIEMRGIAKELFDEVIEITNQVLSEAYSSDTVESQI